jgi:hypothetical protein
VEELPILAVTIPRAANIVGVGESTLKGLIRDGVVETITIGHRRLALFSSLERLIESRRGQGGDPRRNDAVPKAGERRRNRTPAPAGDAA